MRILVVGAGAIGGYFGGRMLQAGRDVTFLVRPKRASELASAGLVIKSPNGDVTLKNPPTVQADTIKDTFDVVVLSCKAFDLEDAIKSFAPAVGPKTAIIPMLNGMQHLKILDDRFGAERVLGGLCAIAVTLERSARGGAASADAVAGLRRARRPDERSRARDCRSVLRRQRRCREPERDPGHVGEMGVPVLDRGLDQPDARARRRHRVFARRPRFPARHSRRMQRRRQGCRPRAGPMRRSSAPRAC